MPKAMIAVAAAALLTAAPALAAGTHPVAGGWQIEDGRALSIDPEERRIELFLADGTLANAEVVSGERCKSEDETGATVDMFNWDEDLEPVAFDEAPPEWDYTPAAVDLLRQFNGKPLPSVTAYCMGLVWHVVVDGDKGVLFVSDENYVESHALRRIGR